MTEAEFNTAITFVLMQEASRSSDNEATIRARYEINRERYLNDEAYRIKINADAKEAACLKIAIRCLLEQRAAAETATPAAREDLLAQLWRDFETNTAFQADTIAWAKELLEETLAARARGILPRPEGEPIQ